MERHSLDPLSLVGGLLLVGTGLLGFFGSIEIGLGAWQYAGPLVLIAIGAVLVLAAPWSRKERDVEDASRRESTDRTAPAESGPPPEGADATVELPQGEDEDS